MIISASRRTDIPTFYSQWFMNRLRAGWLVTINPFNAKQKKLVYLDPQEVDAIVFWTKNGRPMLEHLNELDSMGFRYIFHFTVNDYGTTLEKGIPLYSQIRDTFRQLGEKIGPDRVIWRYDPIIITDTMTTEYHIRNFIRIARELEGYTGKVVISFVDDYRKIATRMRESLGVTGSKGMGVDTLTRESLGWLCREMTCCASACGMEIGTCAEEIDLTEWGIKKSACIDAAHLNKVFGLTMPTVRDKNQRPACLCNAAVDIGIYNTCRHGCAYCYANFSQRVIEANAGKHSPESPVLVGNCSAEEVQVHK